MLLIDINVVRRVMATQDVDFVFRSAKGLSGGILVPWRTDRWKGDLINIGDFSLSSSLVSTDNKWSWGIIGVYGPHRHNDKLLLWEELSSLQNQLSSPWCFLGDFSAVRHPTERKNCKLQTVLMSQFNDWIESLHLRELEIFNRKYTCNNLSASKIDRVLVNNQWANPFSLSSSKLSVRDYFRSLCHFDQLFTSEAYVEI
uniref:Endonuclease/exonuclease/phosphatase domain-containing protein n=1 Tax=Anthurium amnicola TaxID=1678845 RepID=A0A1D1Z7B7_9ARAE